MKIFRHIFCLVLISTLSFLPLQANAQDQGLPPKAKAFLLVSGYGAAGGALLGLASMAFGTSSRAIAQGASLGLYAGILFGTYVLVSHHQRRSGSYESSSPYSDSVDNYDDYGEEPSPDTQGGFFDSSYKAIQTGDVFASSARYRTMETKKGSNLPPFKLNLFSYSF
ncbi:MAG: hypothetical protein K2P81_08885 [Bacteriovoracaceae bacterium]|nr:hypothetical protein [Bacteriovoracaceae bacterium]